MAMRPHDTTGRGRALGTLLAATLFIGDAAADEVVVGGEASVDASVRTQGQPVLLAPFVQWGREAWRVRASMASSPQESMRSQGVCVSAECGEHAEGVTLTGDRRMWRLVAGAHEVALQAGLGVAWRRFDSRPLALEMHVALRAHGTWWHADVVGWLRAGVTEQAEGNRSRGGVALCGCAGRRVGPCLQAGGASELKAPADSLEVPIGVGVHGRVGRMAAHLMVVSPRLFGSQQFLQTRYVLATLAWRR